MTETETNIEEMTNGLLAVVSHKPGFIFANLSDILFKTQEYDDGSPEFAAKAKEQVKGEVAKLFQLIKAVPNERTGN